VPKVKDGSTANNECFHCHDLGHWKSKESKDTSTSGTLNVYDTDIFLTDSYINSWVFDTGSVAHICNSM
jgi:hypothetical protein